ncbi:methyltransferase-like protein 25B [Neocloeon triangulifer]|uniref:methyltransferase-like protein 25B n=1 Tax=Neocloeon triangulifer TaxID=2078957 RepID=UPI00286F42E9|nr:methyltransferase-like protein 25B [Neocloeon triangulifer]XP_059486704.1 methyltransferase-like protein 25B [Neocloeon triangulifer]
MSYCCECNGANEPKVIEKTLFNLLATCEKNENLLKAYMLDFFVEKHWDILPQKWTKVLEKLSPEELGHWVLYPELYNSYSDVWPLSLLALRSTVQHLSLERQPLKENWSKPPLGFRQSCPHRDFLFKSKEEPLNKKLFSKHIKPKKFHEIEIMAQMTANCASRLGCEFVIDIGSGLGHLGRILAFHHGLQVCCLEEQRCLTEKAKKIDEQLIRCLKKIENEKKPPVHINKSIHSALNKDELIKILMDAFGLESETKLKFGLVGLHPCGDLGPTLMRLLTNCENAVFLNLVGCCYMKMADQNNGEDIQGYPMSGFVQHHPQNILSYEAREVSCHALEMYCDRLKNGCVDDLKVHCYRAALECILVERMPELKHSGLKSIKHVQEMSFEKYAVEAVEKLKIKLPACDLDTDDVKEKLSRWMRVVIFYSLRLLVAPLVEAVILLDRLLYMDEKGMNAMLIPAFDPRFSPRNHILVALKEKQSSQTCD